MTKQNKLPKPSAKITMTSEVYRLYKESICKYAPETFALLGGSLNDPFHITDFRFCPPKKDQNGRYEASSVHINVDPEYMNWVIDTLWIPNGKYMLGVWHSHPAGSTHPSYGDPSTNQGDVVFFSACLNGDDSPKKNWNNFIAPITTFDHKGKDQIHGWYLPKGSDQPISTDIEVKDQNFGLKSTKKKSQRSFSKRQMREKRLQAISEIFNECSYTTEEANILNQASRLLTKKAQQSIELANGFHAAISVLQEED